MSQSENCGFAGRLDLRRAERWLARVAVLASIGGLGCGSERETPRGPSGSSERDPGGASSTSGGAPSGSPGGVVCESGSIRACKVTLEDEGGITSCFVGEQTCIEGAWGDCAGTFSSGGSAKKGDAPAGGDGEEGEAPTWSALAGGTAAPCANNACDPTCQVFSESPAAAPNPGCGSSSVSGGSVTALPGGFSNKLLKDFTNPPAFAGCTSAADCQADHRCDAAICQGSSCGKCVAWGEGEFDATDPLPNFTQRTPCEGNVIICNRGGVTAPAGAEVAVLSGNSSQLQANLGACGAIKGSSKGTCEVPSTIAPGACVAVPDCPSLVGTKGLVVNTTSAVENVIPESDCSDNWAVHSPNAAAACAAVATPAEDSQAYQASCPPGTVPQWGKLIYSATVPAGARIELFVDSFPSSGSPSSDCSDCVLAADIPAAAPAVCGLGGPSPCPLSLFETLGGLPDARHPRLELTWRLSSTAGCEAPSLDSWEITYSCVEAE